MVDTPARKTFTKPAGAGSPTTAKGAFGVGTATNTPIGNRVQAPTTQGTHEAQPDVRYSSTATYMVDPNDNYNITIAQQLANAPPEKRQSMYDALSPGQKAALTTLDGQAVNNILVSTGATGSIPGTVASAGNPGFNTPGSPDYLGVNGGVGAGVNAPNYQGGNGGTATPTPTTTPTPTPTTTPTPTPTSTVPGLPAAASNALGILNANLTNPALGANGTYSPVNQVVKPGETLTGEGAMLQGNTNAQFNPLQGDANAQFNPVQGNANVATPNPVNQPTNTGTATVDPATVGNNTPQMNAAQGTVNPNAIVNAPNTGGPTTAEAQQTVLPPEALVTLPQGVLSPDSIAQYAQTSLTPDMMVQAANGSLSPEAMVHAINFQASEAFNQAIEEAKTDAINFPIDPRATVQEQYRQLTDFAPGEIPGWAKGAVTTANQLMARRGVTSSTMAGGEITSAILKAALPIAQQDAQMFATIQLKQFDARQSATILKASHIANLDIQSAQFKQAASLQNAQSALTMDITNLNNEQQARVTNARSLVEVAMNNTGLRQQTALANAAANLSMDLKNMDVQSAAAIENARTVVNTLLANTANRQQTTMYNADIANRFSQADADRRMQASIYNATNFMNMDMTNLSNRQQEAVINTQARIQTMLSDQAVVNAARQFNAQSTNQTNEFFASLAASIEQYNASLSLDAGKFNANMTNNREQFNAATGLQASQFNVGLASSREQFNSSTGLDASKFNANMNNIREQFNASNSLVIEQANVNYLRSINTINTAEQNRANLVNSQNIVQMKSEALQASLQLYRDDAAMTFQSGENALDRANRTTLMEMQIKATKDLQNDAQKAATGSAVGGLVGDVVGSVVKGAVGSIFGGSSGGGSSYGGSFGSLPNIGVGGSFSGGTGMSW